LPTPVASPIGGLIRRDVNDASLAREDHVAVQWLVTRSKEVFSCCERAACAELRTFLQLGRGENRKSHGVRRQVSMELIWSLVHRPVVRSFRCRSRKPSYAATSSSLRFPGSGPVFHSILCDTSSKVTEELGHEVLQRAKLFDSVLKLSPSPVCAPPLLTRLPFLTYF